ncbi:MAG: adenylate/guanylate cyclase domain-containing protein, partial [Anaerolineales bacterium]|nr:adenylate/guanylate cyclase domain-containing protein [Anaerolineales bacterium]
MSQFAALLRTYRSRSTDPERGGSLTQERLGELIGRFLDDLGYTGATISNWERGRTTLSHNDRDVLLALLHALHAAGGLATLAEANDLLRAGDYRALDAAEIRRVAPHWLAELDAAPPPPPADPAPNWQQLQRYLPADLFARLELAPRDAREALCLPHLAALLRTVAMYLPRHQALALLRQPRPPAAQIGGQFLDGSLLFADISEFTRLSEMLRQQAGTAGAEEVVAIINQYLDSMLRILFKYDGRLIKFGGDAMLCLFAGPADAGPASGARSALAAAWEMRQAMAAQFREVTVRQEVIQLDMKVGAEAGTLFAATVGTDAHMEYVLTGSAVEQTARAESHAGPGEIVVSAATHDLVRDLVRARPLPGSAGFYRIEEVQKVDTSLLTNVWSHIEAELAALEADPWAMIARLEAMVPYLPAAILPYVVQQPTGHLEGQYRHVTVLFANFEGMRHIIDAYGTADPHTIAHELNDYIQAVQEEVAYYGGVINKVDLYDQGDKLMVLFGAPQAHERDARRAALTALAMQKALARLSSPAAGLLRQRMGIHTGIAFAGNVGSERNHRREYTVMGDTVNLAARLMSHAGAQEIWLSPDVAAQIRPDFDLEPLPPVALKGIAAPVTPHKLLDAHDWYSRQRAPGALRTAMVGREG